MLSTFLIIIFLIIGMGIIYNNYFNNKIEKESISKNENKNENILNKKKSLNVDRIQYKPFSINENNDTLLNTTELSVKTPYTREKNTTGFFNII